MRTHFLEPTETHMHVHTHTHISKAASIRAQQFSSSLISLVSTVTAGWAEEFCDAPFQSCRRMNGLSVLSAVSPRPNCLSWTRNDYGMWWHNSDSGGVLCSGYTLANYISSPQRAGLSLLSRGITLSPKRTACWGVELWLPIISNNKKPPRPPVKAWALLPALTLWPVMPHCASISLVFIFFNSNMASGRWHALLYKGLIALVKWKLKDRQFYSLHV